MVKKVVALGGVPGTGKTTLVKALMSSYEGEWVQTKVRPTVSVEKLSTDSLEVFGVYQEGEVFAGTDRLSMACQPNFTEYLDSDQISDKIIFEGDRLFNMSFLTSLNENQDVELLIVILDSPPALLSKRYKERGSDQSEKFLKGRESKVERVMSNFDFMPIIEEYSNNNLDDQQKIIKRIKQFLEE